MKKYSLGDTVFNVINYAIMTLVFIVMAVPFFYVVSYSLSDTSKITGYLLLYPRGLNLDSYTSMLDYPGVLNGIFISLSRAVIGGGLMVLVTSMAGFVITRDKLVGIKVIRQFFTLTMFFSAGIIPQYILIQRLHLQGTFLVYIIPGLVNVFFMLLVRAYIDSTPKELEEAAVMDGVNDIQMFFRIIFPLIRPVIAAIALFGAISQWNSFIDTQFYCASSPKLFPLQYILLNSIQTITSIDQYKSYFQSANVTTQSLRMAMTVLTIIPIIIVYPFVQKHFMSGLLLGSIKG